jgi:hypothetical protein
MLRALVSAAVIGVLSVPSVAAAQAPVPIAPADGRVFEWATVEARGVHLVVEAPPGLDFLAADVARDPALTVFADFITLSEEAPGRYEGTALTLLLDPQEDPGTYYWQASYLASLDDPAPVLGPVRSFTVRAPSGRPSVAIGLPAKLLAGRQALRGRPRPAASVRPARPVPDRRRPPAHDLRDRSRREGDELPRRPRARGGVHRGLCIARAAPGTPAVCR